MSVPSDSEPEFEGCEELEEEEEDFEEEDYEGDEGDEDLDEDEEAYDEGDEEELEEKDGGDAEESSDNSVDEKSATEENVEQTSVLETVPRNDEDKENEECGCSDEVTSNYPSGDNAGGVSNMPPSSAFSAGAANGASFHTVNGSPSNESLLNSASASTGSGAATVGASATSASSQIALLDCGFTGFLDFRKAQRDVLNKRKRSREEEDQSYDKLMSLFSRQPPRIPTEGGFNAVVH